MEINDFLTNFADQFDDTEPEEIQAGTKFHNLEEWSSLVNMSVIAMAKTQYGKTITSKEIHECVTVKDLYDLVSSK